MDTTENKTEQYEPFGPEWEKDVMKSSKSVIIQMFKNCAIQCLQLSTVNKPSPPMEVKDAEELRNKSFDIVNSYQDELFTNN